MMSVGCETTAQGSAWEPTYLTALLTVVGFALFWTAFCALLFSGAFVAEGVSPSDGYLLRAFLLVGFCVVSLLSSTRVPDILDKRSRRCAIRIATCLAVSVLLLISIAPGVFGGAPLAVYAVLWLVLGACAGEMLVFWGVVWNGIDADRDENSFCSGCIAGSVTLVAFACSAMLFAPRSLSAAVALVCCIGSAVLQRVCGRLIPPTDDLSSQVSRERLDLQGVTMLTPAASGLALGVALALNGLVLGVDSAFPTALVGIGAGGLIALVVIALRGSTPSVSSVERVTFPVFGACLLVLPFTAGTEAFKAFMVLLLADLVSYLVFHWNALVLLAYRKRLKPVYHFGQGLIATTTATAVGWVCVAFPLLAAKVDMTAYNCAGWGSGGIPAAIAGFPVSISVVSCLGTVAALIAVLSIVPYASNRTIEDLFANAEAAGVPAATALPEENPWDAACELICEEAYLTPREREVFAYLARGRNAEHIAGELIISTHTVKTHTARIYRKLDINSQQQLIDLVEGKVAEG